jgi:hypothetical protein
MRGLGGGFLQLIGVLVPLDQAAPSSSRAIRHASIRASSLGDGSTTSSTA